MDPVGKRITKVHERITDCRHFPVQNPDDVRGIAFVQDKIIKLIIIVNNSGLIRIRRHFFQNPRHDLFIIGCVVSPCCPPALAPSFNLPSNITLRLPEVFKAYLLVINGMEFKMHVKEFFTELFHLRGRERQPWGRVPAQDNATHPFHHIERTADDGCVLRIGKRLRTVRKNAMQRLEDSILPAHVVRRFGLGSKGWPSQHQFPVSNGKQIGEIGISAGKSPDGDVSAQVRNRVFQKRCNSGRVQPFTFSYFLRLVCKTHSSAP